MTTIPDSNSKNWAFAAHISAVIAGYVMPAIGGVLIPLFIWLSKKEEDPFVRDHALEALNFQLTFWLAVIVCIPLAFVLIGIPMLALLIVAHWVFGIIASIKALNGEAYRYPCILRMVTN